MNEMRIVVDLNNRAAVIINPWLFLDSFVVLLVFLLAHLLIIPIVFLMSLQDIVEHTQMFRYYEDIEGIYHESILSSF